MDDSTLPSLPPSDTDSLRRNQYDGFYQVGSREFWGKNEIRSEEVQPFPECAPHEWEQSADGVECKKCHGGLTGGGITVKDGVLSINGKAVKF